MNKLFHFTKSKHAIAILRSAQLKLSPVINCNDPFEMDNTPCFVQFKNENDIKWFCEKILHLKNKGLYLFSGNLINYKNKTTKLDQEIILKDFIAIIKSKLTNNLKLYLPENDAQFQMLRRTAYIACFSKCHIENGILLWSHYADKHSGVAIEFNFNNNQYESNLYKVRYDRKNTRGGAFSTHEFLRFLEKHSSNTAVQMDFFNKTALNKHIDWEYENEVRFIATEHENKISPCIKLCPETITAIYIGLETGNEITDQIISIATQNYPQSKIYKAKKHESKIKLKFDKIV